MPELPEVQTVVNTLRPRLVGHTINRVYLARADIVTPADAAIEQRLLGRTIVEISRRAKRIVFTLDTNELFYIHLGMSGRLVLEPLSASLKPHTHLRIRFEGPDADELRFTDPRRFGGIWWLGRDRSNDEKIGPEPLEVRPRQLAQRLQRTGRAIKNALLDQGVLAGLGNIYADESLFAAGIHPLVPANRLTLEQVKRLNRSIKSTLRRALHHRGSTFRDYRDAEGNAGEFQKMHRVYGREGEPCAKCRTPIKRIVLAGRSSHFCPKCQKR